MPIAILILVTRRRGQGSGGLVERPVGSGTWRLQYSLGIDPATGRRRRGSLTFEAQGRREAEKKAASIIGAIDGDAPGTSVTLSKLLEEWMRFQSGRGRSPTTLHGYQSLIDQRINPALGAIPIERLSVHNLDSFYLGLDRNDGKAPLSPLTVRNIHRVISAALNQAVKWGWIERNPADRSTLPSSEPKEIAIPTPEQAQLLIEACQAKSPNLGAFVFMATVTGCRRGELAAIKWSDVDDGCLRIERSAYAVGKEVGVKSTKNGRIRRIQLTSGVIAWLERWHMRCLAQAAEAGITLHDDAFVFSSWPDGSRPMDVRSIGARVRNVADSIGLKEIHLHSMRHFVATELLASGISARDTADLLGHADPSLTLRVYSHATLDRQRAAAAVIAAVVEPPN